MSTQVVLVDLLYFTGKRGGTETYLREVISRLPEIMPGVRFEAVTNRVGEVKVRQFFPGTVSSVKWVGEGVIAWPVGEMLAVNAVARRVHADVIWSPANVGPLWGGVTRVLTLHDVIYHHLQYRGFAELKRRAISALITAAAKRAQVVITDSQAAASDILATVGIDRSRLHVVHLGASARRESGNANELAAKLGVSLTRPILLSTGNRMPHKNFEGLVRALAAMEPTERPLAVITGSHGNDPLVPLVEELNLQDDVLLLSWVESHELEALYDLADLYVCPSLYEGFGLPVVDSLLRGTAVLANNIEVLREVGGDAISYGDSENPTAFAGSIRDALKRTEREGFQEELLARGSGFTWDATARGVADVLNKALAR